MAEGASLWLRLYVGLVVVIMAVGLGLIGLLIFSLITSSLKSPSESSRHRRSKSHKLL